MTRPPYVLKVSGHELSDEAYLRDFAQAVAVLDASVVVVHGGGKDITALQERLGLEAQFVDGVRVTDQASLAVAEMVLCGVVNKRLVRALRAGGVPNALGLSGVDAGLVRAEKMQASVDMGYTGSVAGVNADVLHTLLGKGFTLVLAPICDGESTNYNVNADHVAAAVARALPAERLTFVSNVEGVLQDGRVLPVLTATQVQALIAQGVIVGGMIPKVQMALDALHHGVPKVAITNLNGLRTHGGTVFTAE
jgi:acetylglutamate kinase